MNPKTYNPGIVLGTVAILFISTLIFQHQSSYFPKDYSYRRLPPWASLSYPILDDYIRPQQARRWILIGDSTLHGDTNLALPTASYRLSEEGDFINLTNPSLAFPVEAWLIHHFGEQYPDKNFIVELNTKWFVSSWVPEKFAQLDIELQHQRGFSRLLSMLNFEDLRFKIQYRWLNERSLIRLWQGMTHQAPEFSKEPFAVQEMMIERRPAMGTKKELIDPAHLEEMSRVAHGDLQAFDRSIYFQALLRALSEHKGHVAVLITPFDPEAVAKLNQGDQQGYARLIRHLETLFEHEGIPYRTVHVSASGFLNYNHYLAAGHDQCFREIKALCQDITH